MVRMKDEKGVDLESVRKTKERTSTVDQGVRPTGREERSRKSGVNLRVENFKGIAEGIRVVRRQKGISIVRL